VKETVVVCFLEQPQRWIRVPRCGW